jgi:hypothetical protein
VLAKLNDIYSSMEKFPPHELGPVVKNVNVKLMSENHRQSIAIPIINAEQKLTDFRIKSINRSVDTYYGGPTEAANAIATEKTVMARRVNEINNGAIFKISWYSTIDEDGLPLVSLDEIFNSEDSKRIMYAQDGEDIDFEELFKLGQNKSLTASSYHRLDKSGLKDQLEYIKQKQSQQQQQ